MGQKVNPYGFRLGTLYGWQSNWFAERRYAEQLHEDIEIRTFIKKKLYHAGISKVVIDRTGEKIVVNIHTARPGILIGKRGAEVETLRAELGSFCKHKEIFINIREIRKAELDAQRAMAEDPDSGWAYYLQAAIDVDRGDYEQALRDLDRAAELGKAAGDYRLEALARTQRSQVMRLLPLPDPTQ